MKLHSRCTNSPIQHLHILYRMYDDEIDKKWIRPSTVHIAAGSHMRRTEFKALMISDYPQLLIYNKSFAVMCVSITEFANGIHTFLLLLLYHFAWIYCEANFSIKFHVWFPVVLSGVCVCVYCLYAGCAKTVCSKM